MAPEVYIYVRKTLDWGDAALVERNIIPAFRHHYDMWNDTFSLAYHEFRHRVRQITDLNFSRVLNARVATLDQIPQGSIIIPTDDDDWFSPEIANGLRAAFDPEHLGYLWKCHTVHAPRSAPARGQWAPWTKCVRLARWALWRARGNRYATCGSNNFAVIRDDTDQPILEKHHSYASRIFDADPGRINRLTERWAIRNRTLASQTTMKWCAKDKDQLVESYERYRRLYSEVQMPSGYRWAEPYVVMMAELMNEVEVR